MERRQEELGIHILENIRNELYYYFPYLDGAFACISGKGSEQTGTIGTDGAFFLFSPEYLLKLYVKKPEAVRRGGGTDHFQGKDPDSGDRRRCEKNP